MHLKTFLTLTILSIFSVICFSQRVSSSGVSANGNGSDDSQNYSVHWSYNGNSNILKFSFKNNYANSNHMTGVSIIKISDTIETYDLSFEDQITTFLSYRFSLDHIISGDNTLSSLSDIYTCIISFNDRAPLTFNF